jgi:hypothetical protein
VLKFLLKLTSADVRSPDDLSVLAGLIVHSLANQTGGGHWLACALAKRVLLSITVGVKGWSSEHSVNVHETASLLEVRHHGWCLEHTKKKVW